MKKCSQKGLILLTTLCSIGFSGFLMAADAHQNSPDSTSSSSSSSTSTKKDNSLDVKRDKKASVSALSKTMAKLNIEFDPTVDLDGAVTSAQKTAVYDAKHKELQKIFEASKK
jgi:hypothetical protein